MTERMASGWMTVWRLWIQGAKATGTQSRWWKQRYNSKMITKESEEIQIEALKEAYEEPKEMYGEENIISGQWST